jgi:hypothetical protein
VMTQDAFRVDLAADFTEIFQKILDRRGIRWGELPLRQQIGTKASDLVAS